MKLNKINEVWNSANSLFMSYFWFGVTQRFCYHDNVTWQLLPSITPDLSSSLPLPWCLTKNHKLMMLRLMDGQSSSLVSCKSIIYLSSHSHELHRRVQKDITWLECFSAKESCSYSKLVLSENGENLQTHWEKREMILFEIGMISFNYTNMWRQ